VRFLSYNSINNQFFVLAQMNFHERCILTTKLLIIHTKIRNSLILCFTAATDGLIAIWDMSSHLSSCSCISSIRPNFFFQSHQSGVNCLDILTIEGNEKPLFFFIILATFKKSPRFSRITMFKWWR
jgi:hypothetical protein